MKRKEKRKNEKRNGKSKKTRERERGHDGKMYSSSDEWREMMLFFSRNHCSGFSFRL